MLMTDSQKSMARNSYLRIDVVDVQAITRGRHDLTKIESTVCEYTFEKHLYRHGPCIHNSTRSDHAA